MFFIISISDLFDTFKEPDGTLTQQGFSELLTDLLLVSDYNFIFIITHFGFSTRHIRLLITS